MSLLSPQLEAFLAVVDQQTVHGAAGVLNLTQTGVTQRIKSLERQLGTSLFLRSRSGMQLTREGLALLRYCEGVRDLEGEALARIKGFGSQRSIELSVSGPSSIMQSRIIPTCTPFAKQYPMLFFSFDLADDDSPQNKLRTGKVQLASLPRDQVRLEMDSKLLRKENYVLVGPTAWADRKVEEIVEQECIIDFNTSDTMALDYLKKAKLNKRARNERYYANNTNAIASAVAQGLGYSVLTKEFAQPLVDRGELVYLKQTPVLEYQQALAWYPRTHAASYFKDIVKAIK